MSDQGFIQPNPPNLGGLHVAIIMDGSGRWATARGLSRSEGHRAGSRAVSRVAEAAAELGIRTLTLFAFSSDNWQRPAGEVTELMQVFEQFLASQAPPLAERGVRIGVLGRRDRLPASLLAEIGAAETTIIHAEKLRLRLAIDYSGREAIRRAAAHLEKSGDLSNQNFSRALAALDRESEPVRDVDLLIRAGGEQRLSDCPLWEIAYAELLFTRRLWPDFDAADLAAALDEFRSRERRYGRIPEPVVT